MVQCIQDTLATPSLAQAQELKRLSQKNELDKDKMVDMLMDVKPNQKEKLSLKMEEINKYFPKSYTPMQKKDIIIKLLGDWANPWKDNKCKNFLIVHVTFLNCK